MLTLKLNCCAERASRAAANLLCHYANCNIHILATALSRASLLARKSLTHPIATVKFKVRDMGHIQQMQAEEDGFVVVGCTNAPETSEVVKEVDEQKPEIPTVSTPSELEAADKKQDSPAPETPAPQKNEMVSSLSARFGAFRFTTGFTVCLDSPRLRPLCRLPSTFRSCLLT